ncbi:MAG: acyltransferase [Bacillota bacterium]
MDGNGNVRIHPSAEVSDDAQIGEDTVIWNNAQVREKAKVGRRCVIGKDVYIDTGVTIGDGVKIQNGVSVYNGVTVEDDVFLGPHMTFTNDLFPRAFIQDWKITPTLVKKGASIGANATIVCGRTIGDYAMVAAGSVVTRDVPAYGLVMGNPARLKGYVCKCGNYLIKTGDMKEFHKNHAFTCSACKEKIQL